MRRAFGTALVLFLATAAVLISCGEPSTVPPSPPTVTPSAALISPAPRISPVVGTPATAFDVVAQFRVDADPDTPGIQTTVTRPVGASFKVRWNIDRGDTPEYQGYQGKMAVDETIVTILSGAPLGVICGPGQACAPAGPVISNAEVHAAEVDELQGTIFGGEIIVEPLGSTSDFAGDVYEVELQCLAEGTSPLDLRPPPDDPLGQNTSLILDIYHPTDTFDAEVTCQEGASR